MFKRLLYVLFYVVYAVPMILILFIVVGFAAVWATLIWIATGEDGYGFVNDVAEWIFYLPNKIFNYDTP